MECVNGNADSCELKGGNDYARYFTQLTRVSKAITNSYLVQAAGGNYEAGIVSMFLKKLLFTIDVLRMKYTYGTGHGRSLLVDLTESGFPSHVEFNNLNTDLINANNWLRELPAKSILQRDLLDHLFAEHKDSENLLWQLSHRTFLEMLDQQKMFLTWTPGLLEPRDLNNGGGDDVRGYVYSWACYDFATNRPYVHIMTFTQDAGEQPLEEGGPNHLRFMEVVQAEGSRAPEVGILAMAIDDAIESIHPKILKRICIGPLYSRLLFEGRKSEELTAAEAEIRRILEAQKKEDDFIAFMSDSIVFSKSQAITKSIFSGKTVREIFSIPETDPDAYQERASILHRTVIMPHPVRQHLDPNIGQIIPRLKTAKFITYDEKGNLHAI